MAGSDIPRKPTGAGRGKKAKAANDIVANDIVESSATEARTRLIAGVGASAGGLEAFRSFFSQMPADSGMAFVLVQHLDPHYESSLVAIIAGYTKMAVHLAQDGMPVDPNQVYIIPPDAILAIKDGVLGLTSPAPVAARRTSINTFLTSLAEDQGENAIGIILSGFGSDGALGIAAIKEHGGLTHSQAEFDHHAKSGMPQSAASGGFVDHVLSVEDMPAALLNYRHHRAIGDGMKGPDGIHTDLPGHLATVCAVLHRRLGRDFSEYKTGTLLRRVQRRMHVLQIDQVSTYIEQLRTLPNEAELLFRELIISVTGFFRDREAFAALEAMVIPGLMADKRQSDPIRIWVAGCATGEEAYSIAILLSEGLKRASLARRVQIFATDVDDRALQFARAGLYPSTVAGNLTAERLERNFIKEHEGYRVTKDLRDMCLFSTHDLVQDPPFSRLALISCRNLLIYFASSLQQRVLTTFHYALEPGGHLFLGPSEGINAQTRLFSALDKPSRIYSRRDTAARLPAFPNYRSREPVRLASSRGSPPRHAEDIDRRANRVMARHGPAFLVVDQNYDVLQFSGPTAKYVEPATGIASLNLFNLLHPDLKTRLRAALKEATTTGKLMVDQVTIGAGGKYEAVKVIVEPLLDPKEVSLFVIGFQEIGPVAALDTAMLDNNQHGAHDLAALNEELQVTRERLRNTTEELEAANEELQSSNEEYLSVNEELQSANEELETSKEELQSLNEELRTVNTELHHRNEGLIRSNSDLANLFDSTSIAILFVDNDLRIRRFTPRVLEIFKIRGGDEGRPITDIVSNLTREGLARDVQQVLRDLSPIEREVMVAEAGMSYLMQVRPYKDVNNVIDGAVITFVDISERKKHEQARSLLAAIIESSQDAIFSLGLDGIVTSWNAGAEQLFGYLTGNAIGQPVSRLLDGALPDDWLTRLEGGERIAQFDNGRTGEDGRPIEVSITISPVRQGSGGTVGASVVARDVSERKAAERKAALLLGELDHRVKNILSVVLAIVSQTLKTSLTPQAFAANVEGRVKAIAAAHGLLTQAGQGAMSLSSIFAMELAPYDGQAGRIVVSGPDVALTPRAGLALAMAIHELASNAAKYGPLSTASGRLSIAWQVTEAAGNHTLTLTWIEAGGPAVEPPTRSGFGTTLIERTLTFELDADVRREFRATGLHCVITMPLTAEIGRVRPPAVAGQLR
jgi:two-component system CheB/CheR fusion protein